MFQTIAALGQISKILIVSGVVLLFLGLLGPRILKMMSVPWDNWRAAASMVCGIVLVLCGLFFDQYSVEKRIQREVLPGLVSGWRDGDSAATHRWAVRGAHPEGARDFDSWLRSVKMALLGGAEWLNKSMMLRSV
jgi:hypothetical protein